jgi:hypothetical protein
MLTIAIQDLKDTAESLSKTRKPIGGWRKSLLERASSIDDYIAIYHPDLHHDKEAYTISHLNKTPLEVTPLEGENDETENIHQAVEKEAEEHITRHVSWADQPMEASPEPLLPSRFENPEKFIEYLTDSSDGPIARALRSPQDETQMQPPTQTQEPTPPIQEKTRKNPPRGAGAPKYLQNFHCYSLLETALLEEKADSTIGLDEKGDPLTYRTAMAGPFAKIWSIKLSEEYIRLTETGTIKWDGYRTKPSNKKATYISIQVKEKRMANGTIKRRVRCTVGGDRVTVTGETSSATASMDVLKILLNAVASEDSYWVSIDIADYYLGTPMDEADHQWMYIDARDIPHDIRQKYDIEIRT